MGECDGQKWTLLKLQRGSSREQVGVGPASPPRHPALNPHPLSTNRPTDAQVPHHPRYSWDREPLQRARGTQIFEMKRPVRCAPTHVFLRTHKVRRALGSNQAAECPRPESGLCSLQHVNWLSFWARCSPYSTPRQVPSTDSSQITYPGGWIVLVKVSRPQRPIL